MNRREWVLYGQKELEEAQIENASGDAWYLFSECFHISREDYLFGMIDEINDKDIDLEIEKLKVFQENKQDIEDFITKMKLLKQEIELFINHLEKQKDGTKN